MRVHDDMHGIMRIIVRVCAEVGAVSAKAIGKLRNRSLCCPKVPSRWCPALARAAMTGACVWGRGCSGRCAAADNAEMAAVDP